MAHIWPIQLLVLSSLWLPLFEVQTYIGTAHIVVAHLVMVHIGMAHIAKAHIVISLVVAVVALV